MMLETRIYKYFPFKLFKNSRIVILEQKEKNINNKIFDLISFE
jgi:hypothetical protein